MKLGHLLLLTLAVVASHQAHSQSEFKDDRPRPRSFNDKSAPYAKRVGDAIKYQLIDPGLVDVSSLAEVELNVEPNGTIASYKLVRSVGSPAWEAAVMKAMAKSDRIPLDVNGNAPATIIIEFRP